MDEKIMYKEIGHTVKTYSDSYPKKNIQLFESEVKAKNSGDGENQEEQIISLKCSVAIRLMMIFMQNP